MKKRNVAVFLFSLLLIQVVAQAAEDWWNNDWVGRKPWTINTTSEGGDIKDGVGTATVLVRLHQGNFPFAAARDDGGDLRFVAADGETLLPFHIEKWDSLMLEGLVWVQVPEIAGAAETPFWLYYGNPEPDAESGPNVAATFPEGVALAYHFNERGSPPKDASENANNAGAAGTISEAALIASGMRLLGADPIPVPSSDTLEWSDGEPWWWSIWFKASQPEPNAILLSRAEGGTVFRVGVNDSIPFVSLDSGGSVERTAPGDPVAITSWTRLDVVADAGKIALYVNGEPYGEISASLPAMAAPFLLGGDPVELNSANNRLVGEIDEMRVSSVAPADGAVAFLALNQSGSEASQKLLVPGEDEGSHGGGGHNETLEHMLLFVDIAENMMFDGWIAVFVCILMMIAGWSVAAGKFVTLSKIQKGNEVFQRQWEKVGGDLTVLDNADPEQLRSFGGAASKKAVKLMHDSPIYHVYHIGAQEIQSRLGNGKRNLGLSARSIQAIRAALDTGLVREQFRLNKGIVMLTTSIAGGPYVGLLGTVVGVMITFAIVAKSGEVDVNSIAPGIASALLATTMGLFVAIPALFMYSYLSGRIKESISAMQVFIDEFVAKVAEFYPTPSEAGQAVATKQVRSPEAAAREEEKARDEEVRDELEN